MMLLHGHLFIEDCYKRRGISQGRWDNNHESIELFNISTNSSFLGFLLILEFLISSSNPVFFFFFMFFQYCVISFFFLVKYSNSFSSQFILFNLFISIIHLDSTEMSRELENLLFIWLEV